ncbi:MAG: 6-phosphogluconolactonase [Abitibacteriaceae bacterium]|nr:6-phosphogluconolactonase [Abditibacteriaceae bacterium]
MTQLPMNRDLIVKPTAEEVVQTAAELFVGVSHESIAARNRFSVALAGGSTPRALYQLLASAQWQGHIDWSKTHIFFGDERAVPPDDEQSNYRMARESLLAHIPIAPAHIHRLHGEEANLEAAAQDYERQLRELQAPLDLVLLGMGDDGHTSSLFPHTPALQEQERWCVATDVAPHEPHVRRLTLTYPVLNAAHNIFIIVTGASKAERLRDVLEGASHPLDTPIQGIQPQQGRLVWMLDAAAARLLSH